MKMYRVQIAQSGKQDLLDVVRYDRFQFREPGTAQKIYKMIQKQISELDHLPERFPLWEDEPWHSRGLRRMLVCNYLAFYLVDHEHRCVQVTRIIYAERDISKILEETDFESL